MTRDEGDRIKEFWKNVRVVNSPDEFEQAMPEREATAETRERGWGRAPEPAVERQPRRAELERQRKRRELITNLLDSTIAATEADCGDVQLFDPAQRTLAIVAQRGFENDFLRYFDVVHFDDGCSCGAATREVSRVVVPDTVTDPVFSEPSRAVLLRAGIRSVQSTPLIEPSGQLLGVVSTHYRHPNGYHSRMDWVADLLIASFLEARNQIC
jgi:GAF domain-containing protein